ncbi:hypothetical protein QTP88_016404 [Uroleucon formosanum]
MISDVNTKLRPSRCPELNESLLLSSPRLNQGRKHSCYTYENDNYDDDDDSVFYQPLHCIRE